MEKEITKEYAKGEFIIVWKPKKCIHSKVCVHTLPWGFNLLHKKRNERRKGIN